MTNTAHWKRELMMQADSSLVDQTGQRTMCRCSRRQRTMAVAILAAMAMTAGVDPARAQEGNKAKTAFLSTKDAGPDFQLQGEYIGLGGGANYGAQVIARGNGKFEAVVYAGGLPGAGWDEKTKHRLTGETKEGVTRLSGEGLDAAVGDGHFAFNKGDVKATLVKLHRESPTLAARPPEGAVVLFDGTNVDGWNPGKLAENGLMGVGTRTKQKFGSFKLHLEFQTPFMPYAQGQARGNSGMYLHDQYECQILDSFGLEGKDNECGGIYQNAKPKVNMCLPPLSWQTYDVEMTAATWDAEGKVQTPAKVSIRHNGVVIHENLELKPTPGGGQKDQKPGALYLQDHGDPVRFRNIWLVETK